MFLQLCLIFLLNFASYSTQVCFTCCHLCRKLVTPVKAALTPFPSVNTVFGSCLLGMVSRVTSLMVCSHIVFAEVGGATFVNVNKAAAGIKDRFLSAGHHS